MVKRSRKRGKSFVLAVLVAALVMLVILALAVAAPGGQEAELLTQQEVNAELGSHYNYVSLPACKTTTVLLGSGVSAVCTEVLGLFANGTGLPQSITLFYYKFISNKDALFFVQNASAYINDTPWPYGLSVFSNLSKVSNVTVYFTTITGDTRPPLTTLTIYTLSNSTVFGVSSYALTALNKTAAKDALSNLLYKQYLKGASYA